MPYAPGLLLDASLHLGDAASELLHLRIVRLERRALRLVLGLEVAAALAQLVEHGALQRVGREPARHLRLPPDRLGVDAVRRRSAQCVVQLLQVATGERRVLVHARQPLLLRKLDERALAVLELELELREPILEEGASVLRILLAPAQIGLHEGLGQAIGDPLGDARVGTHETHACELRIADGLDLAIPHDSRHGLGLAALEAPGGGGVRLGILAAEEAHDAGDSARPRRRVLECLVGHQPQLAHRAQRQGAALEQLDLGAHEVAAGIDGLHAFDLHDTERRTLDLQRRRGAVQRRLEQCPDERDRRHQCSAAQYCPAALEQDVPGVAQGEFLLLVIARIRWQWQPKFTGGLLGKRTTARRPVWQAIAFFVAGFGGFESHRYRTTNMASKGSV
jgi:hypothetical protein